MTISRRSLILGAGSAIVVGGVTTGVVAWPHLFGGSDDRQLDLGTATAEMFRQHVGTTFRGRRADQSSFALTLTHVEQHVYDGKTDSFSLSYAANTSLDLGQATYHLEHADLGSFDMFLVQRDATTARAVINHLLLTS